MSERLTSPVIATQNKKNLRAKFTSLAIERHDKCLTMSALKNEAGGRERGREGFRREIILTLLTDSRKRERKASALEPRRKFGIFVFKSAREQKKKESEKRQEAKT